MHLQAYAVEGTNEVIQIHISHTARLKDQIIICTRRSDEATVYKHILIILYIYP